MAESIGIFAGLGTLLVTLMLGVPVFVGLGLGGLVGASFYVGPAALLESGHMIFGAADSLALLAIPGFILMGNLYFYNRFGNDLFVAADRWIGHIRGGLLVAATAMGAAFGFICGSAAAGTATIGSVVIPEIDKRGYDRALGLGSIAIGGSLSALIPPSLLMIVYASLAEASLGRLFFAGIIPGLVLALAISIYIYLRAKMDHSLCPTTPSASWRARFASLTGMLPVIVAFFVIFGGMYVGAWSAIEAAPIGAVLALITCLLYRRLTWASLKASVLSTLKISSMVYMIIIAASLLNYFVFLSRIDQWLVGLVTGLDIPGWVVVVLVFVILTAMGCIFDVMALVIISTSIYLPVIKAVGYDPVWFGIMLILAAELALITPPVGVNLFIVKDLAPKGTSSATIIRGALPYVVVIWICMALFIAFPEIILWLPSQMIE